MARSTTKSTRTRLSGLSGSSPLATSHPAESSGEASLTSAAPMLLGGGSATSSLASRSGRTRSEWRACQMTLEFGQAVAPASRSATPAKAKPSTMTATFGPSGSASSSSADLQASLESRLRAALVSAGSTLYALTWKERATPSGLQICQLQASAHRTNEAGFSSVPTPVVSRGDYSRRAGDPDDPVLKLSGVAKLSTVATPAAQEAGGTPEQFIARKAKAKAKANGSALGLSLTSLSLQASLSTVTTPSARDWKDSAGMSETGVDPDGSTRSRLDQLPRQAQLAASGVAATGTSAETASTGQLDPAYSRWLMGLPPEWDACAPTVTRSSRRSRPPSSPPASKP